jgi:hypothetical protein
MPRQIQRIYPDPPAGYDFEEFEYVFNAQTAPSLGTSLAPGQQLLHIPLQLQSDAPYYWREIIVNAPQQGLGMRFTDPFGNQLSDGYVPGWVYAGALVEPEILCPAGSVILVDLTNTAT